MPDQISLPTDSTTATSAVVAQPSYTYKWLLDEHVLRDEGAFYGLSDSNIEEKQKTIQLCFDARLSALNKAIEIDEQELSTFRSKSEQLQHYVDEKETKLLELRQPGESLVQHFIPVVMQLVLFGLLAVGIFILPNKYLTADTGYSFMLSVGVYLFGMFAVMWSLPASENADRLSEKSRFYKIINKLKIYINPFIAAIFATFYGYNGLIYQSLLVFVLLFALFVYSGKSFLPNLLRLQKEWRVQSLNRANKKYIQQQIQMLQQEVADLKTELKRLEEVMEKLRQTIRENKIDQEQTKTTCAAAISYFKSEYELARSSRQLGIYP